MSQNCPKYDIVDDAMAGVLREKTERERLEIAFGMWRFARNMMEKALRAEYPDWSNEQIQRQVAKRMSHGAV